MKPRRAWAMARKEILHIVRDPRSLAMALAFLLLNHTASPSLSSLRIAWPENRRVVMSTAKTFAPDFPLKMRWR